MKIYSENKKAGFDYEVLEKFQAGIVLFGQEVKSIKTGHINLSGSYVTLNSGEPFLVGVKVPPYQPNNAGADYGDERAKKLLLNKKEIIILTKTDLVDASSSKKAEKSAKKLCPVVFAVSILDEQSIKNFSDSLVKILREL